MADANRETIGERVRRLRVERGLTLRQAASPGVSSSYLSRIESGERAPSVKALRALAQTLGVSPDELETGDSNPPQMLREVRFADAELALRLGQEPEQAVSELEVVLQEAEAAADTGLARRARLVLGLAASEGGAYEEAIAWLEQVVGDPAVTPLTRPDAYLSLARAHAATGRGEVAVELLRRCLAEIEIEDPSPEPLRVRYATHLSYALADMGDFVRARTALATLADPRDVGDRHTRVRLYWSRSRLASMEGDTQQAVELLREAIHLLDATEDTAEQARAHLLCAEILVLDGDAAHAESHLGLAEHLFEVGGSSRDKGAVLATKAKCAAARGDTAAALHLASDALVLLEEHGIDRAGAWHALGTAHALNGDVDAADDYLRQAVEALSGSGEWREASQACKLWAKTLKAAGRTEEAFVALERGADIAMSARPNAASPAPR